MISPVPNELAPPEAGLEPLDVATGFPYGKARGYVLRPPGLDPAITPLAALEAQIAPALLRGSVFVSFSGGFDSSLVLAAATSVARRLGVADPIPLTWRFTDAMRAQESDWQEAVVSELRLGDWQRLTATDELDWLGPVATEVLRAHGLLYPANSFLHAPLLALAKGGTLLTGVGGDQVLGLWRGRVLADLLAGRRTPSPRDLGRIGLAMLPHPARTLVADARADPELAWLTPLAKRELGRRTAAEIGGEPMWWRDKLPWRVARRDTELSLRSLELLAAAAGCQVASPLLAPEFVAALAHAGGRLGAGDRLATLQRWFAPVLPRSLDGRRDKALFGQVFWREASLAYAKEWEGGDTDAGLIDEKGLRREWRSERPNTRTALLLQQQWLTQDRASAPTGSKA
jgi:asparagine synthase (glutamine-hydrolysing)